MQNSTAWGKAKRRPHSPEVQNSTAWGKAKRRLRWVDKEMQAEGLQLPATSGRLTACRNGRGPYPGRRFAMPWAVVCQPFGLWGRCPCMREVSRYSVLGRRSLCYSPGVAGSSLRYGLAGRRGPSSQPTSARNSLRDTLLRSPAPSLYSMAPVASVPTAWERRAQERLWEARVVCSLSRAAGGRRSAESERGTDEGGMYGCRYTGSPRGASRSETEPTRLSCPPAPCPRRA